MNNQLLSALGRIVRDIDHTRGAAFNEVLERDEFRGGKARIQYVPVDAS